MTENHRPIEPEMRDLWDNLDAVSINICALIRSYVGDDRGFTLLVHPKDEDHATLRTTTIKNSDDLVRQYMRNSDEGRSITKPSTHVRAVWRVTKVSSDG